MQKLAVLSVIGIVVGGIGTIGSTLIASGDDGSVVSTAPNGERSYDAAGFERVTAIGPHQVEVKVGPAFSVHASGAADTLDRYEVVVEGGELKIQPKHGNWWGMPWAHPGQATFEVTMPRILAASFFGSGDMRIDRVNGDRFAASVAGSGTMEIAQLSVDDAEFSVAGSGDMTASGKARNTHVSVAGSGDMRASGLTSDTAHVSVAGSGDAELTVNGEADVSTVGSGDVKVGGTAHCTVSRIGSGSVSCPNSS